MSQLFESTLLDPIPDSFGQNLYVADRFAFVVGRIPGS